MAKRKLTAQQKKFKNNILSGMNGKAAYIAAGYKARGAAAEVNASKLLRITKVAAAIEEAQKKAAYKAEVTAERILREEMCLAFLNPHGLVDKNGKLLDLHKLPEDVARAIVGLEVTEVAGILKYKYKFSDKGRSLERISRHLGMYNDKLNLGFSAETLNAILAGLPPELAEAIRTELGKLVSGK
jgi:phage terminase small subunit